MKRIDEYAVRLGITAEELKSELMPTSERKLVSYRVACEMLSISKPTLATIIASGRLSPVVIAKHPKIRVSEIDAILAA